MRLALIAFVFVSLGCGPNSASSTHTPVSNVAETAASPALVGCSGRPRFVSNDILLPEPLHQIEPDYSKCQGIRGRGNPVLEATIGKDGKVLSARVVKPAFPCIDRIAVEALEKWTFCPGEQHGKPIEMTMQFTVNVNYK